MSARHHLLAGCLAASVALFTCAATAQTKANPDPAWVYFNAGQQAYAAGKYTYAIQAFQQAYKIEARAGLVFSIAQAHRKQYVAQRRPQDLRDAVAYYRQYLASVPEGGRRADAVAALEELEPTLERVLTQPGAEVMPSPEETTSQTRLMVSSSVKEARIEVDKGQASEMPLMAEVKPGKHTLRVTAKGYFPEEREVVAAEGGIVALDIPLREKPAVLDVVARSGSQVTIDGRPAGELPFGRPLEVAPGSRFVMVTRNGYKPFAQEIDLERGEKAQIVASLAMTKQRLLSYVVIGASVSSVGLGILLAAGAADAEGEAEEILARRDKGSIRPQDLINYSDHVERRNFMRLGAGVTLGAAAAFAGAGALLFFFDQPTLMSAPTRQERSSGGAAPTGGQRTFSRVSAAPVWTPDVAGLTLQGRF